MNWKQHIVCIEKEMDYLRHVPSGIIFDPVPGADVHFLHGEWGHILIQDKPYDTGFYSDTQMEIIQPAYIRTELNQAVYELHSTDSEPFITEWKGAQLPPARRGVGGMTFTPDVDCTVRMAPGSYRTRDLHFAPAVLERYETTYEQLGQLLDSAAKRTAFSIQQSYRLNGKLRQKLQAIAVPDCREGAASSYAALMAEGMLIQALEQMHRQPNRTLKITPKMLEHAREAEQLILSDRSSFLTLSELAKQVGTNNRYLHHAFKELTSLTIGAYQQQLRLHAAVGYLKDSPSMPLSEIAAACGFSHEGAFSDAFLKVYGIRPGAYRKNNYLL